MNHSGALIRRRTDKYPYGRTSKDFKDELQSKVTVIDKNKKKVDKEKLQGLDHGEKELDDDSMLVIRPATLGADDSVEEFKR